MVFCGRSATHSFLFFIVNYINKDTNQQIANGELVRVKIRNTRTSESTTLIDADYGMSASSNSISQNSKKSTENAKKVSTNSSSRSALSDSSLDNNGDKGYNYTKGQYEQFGWAREANALSKNELDDLYSKIQARSTLRTFKRSSKGEAIIKVNNEPHTKLGVNNVFVFVKGTKNNFKISRVVRFDAQTEVEMEIYEEALYAGRTCSDTYLAFLEEQEVTREYRVENYKSFAEYKRSLKDRETSRGTDQDNRGPEEHGSGHSQALGENGETNVRYSLSDEDGDGYNDDLYTTTDDFVREVIYYDRSAFARSLANKTSDMKKGETRTIMILGATRNNLSRVYWFSADGYMHGKMISVEIIDDKKEIKRKEYKNGIDGDTKIVDL